MLTEQKRYLYPLYLIIAYSFSCIINLIIFIFIASNQNGLPETTLLGWLLYCLVPIMLLVSLLSRKIWFGKVKSPYHTKLVCSPICIALAGIALASGFYISCRQQFQFVHLSGACNWVTGNIHLFLAGYGVSLAMLPVIRQSLRFLVKRSGPESNLIKSVLIIGTGSIARDLAEKIDRSPTCGMRVTGFLSTNKKDIDHFISGHCVLGVVESLGTIRGRHIVDLVLVAPEKEHLRHMNTILQRCQLEGIDIGYITSLDLYESSRTGMEQLEDLKFWIIRGIEKPPEKLLLKRCSDFFASAVLIFFCLPVWILLPILIRRDSPGPVLFRQTRVGKNGRLFYMYKFRSMVVGAENLRHELIHLNEMDGPAFKMTADPRVTRLGTLLRKTSLDELPQLFNVLKGDISLVGPRPALLEEVHQYRPWEKKRFAVQQGITGFWQVSGRNEIKFDEWMKLDLMYIEQWRFMLDIILLLKTVPAVIARKGAQ